MRALPLLTLLWFVAVPRADLLGQAHSLQRQAEVVSLTKAASGGKAPDGRGPDGKSPNGNTPNGRQVTVTYTFKNANANLVERWFRLALLPTQRIPVKIEMANSSSIHMSGLDRDVDAMLNLIRKVDFGSVPSNFSKDRDGDLDVEWRLFILRDQTKHLDVNDVAVDITISNGIVVSAGQPKHLDKLHNKLRSQAHDLFETRVWRCHSMQQIQALEKSAVDAGIAVVELGTEKDVRSTTFPFVMVVAGWSSVFEEFDMEKAGSPIPQVEPVRFQLRNPLVSVSLAKEVGQQERQGNVPKFVGSIEHLAQHLENAELEFERLREKYKKDPSSVTKAEFRSALTLVFNSRIGLQEAQLDIAQKNLDLAQERIKDRKVRKELIVNERLDEFLAAGTK